MKNKVMVCIKIWSITTVFNIDKNKKCLCLSKSAYYDSEGSCDTEDWSNDAENHLQK